MNVTVEKLQGDKVLLNVELTKDEFNIYYEEELNKLLANAEVKGFRKGKVPRSIYLNKFGEGQIIQNAIDAALSKTYYQALKEQKVQAIDEPKVDIDFEKFSSDRVLKYKAEVQVYPEVVLGKYYGIEIEKESTEVNDADIEKQIQRDLKNKSDLELVEDGALENGYTAVFDFEGFMDDVPFEGGKAENYTLEIGSGQFIPGFEEQMVGMKTGEEKTITVNFPEDYHAENLKGKPAQFKVKLHEIKKRVLPEVNDDFVKELSIEGVTNVNEYKDYIKNKLVAEKKESSENKFEYDVINKVCENAKVEVPEVLVERQKENMLKQEEARSKGYGITFEQLLAYQGMTLDQFKEQLAVPAKQEVLKELVLNKIIEVENITLTDEDYQKGYEHIAKIYNQDVETVKKQFKVDRIAYHFLIEKAIDLIKEKAVIK